jgi:integrase/recombinase XerC/integrase/recombinase XerD
MTNKDLTIVDSLTHQALPVFPLGRDQYIKLAAEWFSLDVSNGDARQDTIDAYMSHLKHWLTWCQVNRVDPARPMVDHVKAFRRELVNAKLAHNTIALKLTTIRRFYDGALLRGLIEFNPAKDIRPPRVREAEDENLLYFETEDATSLFQSIPSDGRLKSLRDRAMIGLMTIGGLRRVEICRANVSDMRYKHVKEEPTCVPRRRLRMLVHGKGRDRHKYIRDDVASSIERYLMARKAKAPSIVDDAGEPLFVSLSKADKPLSRITRDGLTRVLNFYLVAADLRVKLEPAKRGEKRPRQRSCHALRHTYGTELWRKTGDLKIVQEELGHSTVVMAARYSHVDKKSKTRAADGIPIDIGGSE